MTALVTLNHALAVLDAGFAVVPPKEDGSKAPSSLWRQYEHTPPDRATVADWYRNGRAGIGFVCGASSGNLEMLELEGRAMDEGMLDALWDRGDAAGLGALLDRIADAYMETSPSGGVHFLYRVDGEVHGNRKLAQRPQERPLPALALIETRGQGGYTVAAPSGGRVHPDGGSWTAMHGQLSDVVTITTDERDRLHALCTTFDEMPAAPPPQPKAPPTGPAGQTTAALGDSWFDSVVDSYNEATTWGQVLEGWTERHTSGHTTYWTRAGKDPRKGSSATTNYYGNDRIIFFTSSLVAGFEPWDGTGLAPSYDRFSYTAIMDHDGDRTATARALNAQGYGRQRGESTGLGGLLGPSLQEGLPSTPSAALPSGAGDSPPPAGWPELGGAAYHGPIGDYVRAAAPHTEADPVAILVQLLVGVGCLVNRGPHVLAGNERHPAALFAAIVGATAKGKKGTSWSAARIVLDQLDAEFTRDRILGGFGSGEILVETIANEGNDKGDDEPRSRDTRTLVMEGELASILAVAGREKSTLGQHLRNGWDGRTLAARTRGKTTSVARDYQLCVIGHITIEELRATLSEKDTFGGTTNRFLWIASRRARLLPEGGNIPDDVVEEAATVLRRNIAEARRHAGVYKRSAEAGALWAQLYETMAADEPPGLLGAAIARAEAQVLRLSLAYAIVDGATEIELIHVQAAWALWQYSRATCALIFPQTTTRADTILQAVTEAKERGLTRTEIYALFDRNLDKGALDSAVGELTESGAVVEVRTPSGPKGGRPVTTVYLAKYAPDHEG